MKFVWFIYHKSIIILVETTKKKTDGLLWWLFRAQPLVNEVAGTTLYEWSNFKKQQFGFTV